mmetsp:Transcript_23738/g.57530  ORF Transcript_23738/g.57530 Transcript_23738/m.57530 type:complete len:207 (-) Transcript_23738:1295-1915(-)
MCLKKERLYSELKDPRISTRNVMGHCEYERKYSLFALAIGILFSSQYTALVPNINLGCGTGVYQIIHNVTTHKSHVSVSIQIFHELRVCPLCRLEGQSRLCEAMLSITLGTVGSQRETKRSSEGPRVATNQNLRRSMVDIFLIRTRECRALSRVESPCVICLACENVKNCALNALWAFAGMQGWVADLRLHVRGSVAAGGQNQRLV